MTHKIDNTFQKLKPDIMAQFAIKNMKEYGVEYGDFRFERVMNQSISMHDLQVENVQDETETGFAIRVIVDGVWGFAASSTLTKKNVRETIQQAIVVASNGKVLVSEKVNLANEPIYKDKTFISNYKINPFDIPIKDKITLLNKLSEPTFNAKNVNHVDFHVRQVMENKYFSNTLGTTTNQQRVRVQGQCTAISVDTKTGQFVSMRTCSLPVAKGWEYFTSDYDFASEIGKMPVVLQEKQHAPSVKAGTYDLVIDPTNLWLTIHESVGHATELDRVLGYEANYAGTSFATLDKLGTLQYGSKLMNITGDRTVQHGLATTGYDDEGVAATRWDIVKEGILTDYQLNRQMAAKLKKPSNGCAFADSFSHIPLQRMPNVSLMPNKDNVSTKDLISQVENGLYVVGDNSWSIDMQRYNFQFTAQRFYLIKNGKLCGQVKDAAYQSNTLEFWNKLDGLGGKSTYVLGGAFNCGKGQPGQVACVSHGAPVTLFRDINVLNTVQEGKS